MEEKRRNPLGYEPVGGLMRRFALPSIVAMLVSAIYNIVDQLFIGHCVGTLGNAATNVAFPLSMLCTACALLFGIGGASNFNLSMGRGEREKAGYFVGNAAMALFASGALICLVTEVFLQPMLIGFGAPGDVLPYAKEYVSVTALGFPFLILTIGSGHLIRADGKPTIAMTCNLSGAIINTVLDALFVVGFHWGMKGAALATILGQIFSAGLAVYHLYHYRTVKLTREHVVPKLRHLSPIAKIGAASFINQLAMMLVQIVLNNSLTFYGKQSAFGESVPLAVAGIVTKVSQVFFAVVIGIAQGSQPIESFNYGARRFPRVREAFKLACVSGFAISAVAFVLFQTIPKQIIAMFGTGSDVYYEFGSSYFRVYLFFICLNWFQPITSTLFTSIGKPIKGIFLSLTRQVLFLIPLLLILPRFFGIDGILYSGFIADGAAFVCTLIMARLEFNDMKRLELTTKPVES